MSTVWFMGMGANGCFPSSPHPDVLAAVVRVPTPFLDIQRYQDYRTVKSDMQLNYSSSFTEKTLSTAPLPGLAVITLHSSQCKTPYHKLLKNKQSLRPHLMMRGI